MENLYILPFIHLHFLRLNCIVVRYTLLQNEQYNSTIGEPCFMDKDFILLHTEQRMCFSISDFIITFILFTITLQYFYKHNTCTCNNRSE